MPTQLDQVLERVEGLPRLDDTTSRLINVINDPSSSMADIVDTIRYDTSLTTELLKRCNSAYFGLERKITSIDDAARFLGTAKLMHLVMAAHSHSLFSPPQSGYGLPPGALWVHSVGVAIGSATLAERLKLPDRGILFTAGLLHDVGKIILNELVGEVYAQIIELVRDRRFTFTDAERELLGYTHAEVGGIVAERWNLPDPIVLAVRYHHEPAAVNPPNPIVDVVHLADVACLLLGIGGGDDGQMYRADTEVIARYGLHEHDIEMIGAGVVAELKSVREVFETK